MEYWKRNRIIRFITKPPLFCFLSIFLFSISALFFTISSSTTCPDSTYNLSAKVDTYFQELDQKPIMKKKMMMMLQEQRDETALRLLQARRYLSGPGSSPPRCTSKCGSCTPCKPVHVPVPPGTPVTAEYYPEAWRCKCGNKLYMP